MFSQKWDIPHPYRISLYDSFYSKLNEGSLMGEGGALWFPAPFLPCKENPPRDGPHSGRRGLILKCTDRAGSAAHAPEVGTGLGSWARGSALGRYNEARENFLFSPVSHIKGVNRGKTARSSPRDNGTYVLGASFQMTQDVTSPLAIRGLLGPRGWSLAG